MNRSNVSLLLLLFCLHLVFGFIYHYEYRSFKNSLKTKISEIEDDGYSQNNQILKRIIRRVWGKITRRKPGRLIVVRHGETNLNYNKTFTGFAMFRNIIYLNYNISFIMNSFNSQFYNTYHLNSIS